jgi:Tol biopolymer transport system component
MKTTLTCVAALLWALAARPASAQLFTRPWLEWRTVRTEHFEVHYPAELSAWTLDVVSRLETVHDSVRSLVGYAPGRRVRILVEEPSGQSNGSAFSFLDRPTISLWPTPPDPRSDLGNNRGPGEQLIIHEFAHIAHLTRPSRAPGRIGSRLLPVRLGPVSRGAPRWVTEGYATYVEGRLTGSGRPHSAVRAAVLRQWALEGRLPTYPELSRNGTYYGGNMAYLAGSAYLEWLVDRRGEASLEQLWRRMTARQPRSFESAFAGVYGGTPQELYGLFTVDVTARALEARSRIAAAGGTVGGDTVQRLRWTTGDPAVSPDGERIAIVLRGAPGVPSRVVVWKTRDPGADSADAAEARKLLARDSLDVPGVRYVPRARAPLATLLPVDGRGHDAPRFLPGGKEILLVRSEPIGGGATRPDLFVWEWASGRLRRVTRGSGIRSADPAPDGRSAAAVACGAGVCSLVRVDLATGAIRTLAPGTPDVVFHRPRWAADGESLVVSVQERGRWRIARVDAATGTRRYVDPDDGASRYEASWLPGGRELVTVSERGGVANLEILDPATGTVRPLTRVTGAALAPDPNPATGDVFFLSLHAAGLDLKRIHPDSAGTVALAELPAALAPAAPRDPGAPRDTLPRAAVPPSRPYGVGPRTTRILPVGGYDADGGWAGLSASSVDPVGRLTLLARGVAGRDDAAAGGSLAATWRGWRPAVTAELFHTLLPQLPATAGTRDRSRPPLTGATLFAEVPWRAGRLAQRFQAGASGGSVERTGSRFLGFAEYGASTTRGQQRRYASAAVRLNAAAGSTDAVGWSRGIAAGSLSVGLGPANVRADGSYGRVSAGAPVFERMSAGGSASPLVDDAPLAQRIPLSAAPFGIVSGRELATYRVSTRLGGVTPYLWGAALGDGAREHYRVAGVEGEVVTGPGNVLGVPGVRFTAGIGMPLDSPRRHKPQAYFGLNFQP